MIKLFAYIQLIFLSISCSFIKPSEIKINNKSGYDIIVTISNNSSIEKFKITKNKHLWYQTFPTNLTIYFSDLYNIKNDIQKIDVSYLSYYEIDYTTNN